MNKYLKALRVSRGLSQADVAAYLNISPENYNRLENGRVEFTLSRMKQLAELFNCAVTDLISASAGTRQVEVICNIQAGYWSDATEWDDERRYDVVIPDDPEFRGKELIGGEIKGSSMNKRYPDGSVVIITNFYKNPEELMPGKRYVVERERADGMRETTVKTLAKDDYDKFWLMPESTDPHHQTPLEINGDDGETIRILGKVVYAVRRED